MPIATKIAAAGNRQDDGSTSFGTNPPRVSPTMTLTAKIQILNNHVISHPMLMPRWRRGCDRNSLTDNSEDPTLYVVAGSRLGGRWHFGSL